MHCMPTIKINPAINTYSYYEPCFNINAQIICRLNSPNCLPNTTIPKQYFIEAFYPAGNTVPAHTSDSVNVPATYIDNGYNIKGTPTTENFKVKVNRTPTGSYTADYALLQLD